MKNTLKLDAYKPLFDFIFLFIFLFAILYSLLSATNIPSQIAAYSSQSLLHLISKPSTLIFENQIPILKYENLDAQITDLCSAGLEIAVLVALIFATFEKSLQYRLKGAIAAVLFLLILNAIRITITVATFGTLLFDLTHELLFRSLLIASIILFYALWYYWKK